MAVCGAGFEGCIGVFGAVDGISPDRAALHGVEAYVDVGRTVGVAEVAAAEDVALHRAAHDVQY